jgi:hypothetical protein
MSNEVKYSVLSLEAGRKVIGLDSDTHERGGPPPGITRAEPSKFNFSQRLDTLENKIVYLVDIGFGGGYNFMTRLQKWFNENMPSVTTVIKRKPGRVFSDDNHELWDEVKEKGHAVILGVAG